jgi:hypothetical protein
MELIKENKEKQRAVFFKDEDTVRKIWYNKDLSWVANHVSILEKIVPDYAKAFGHEDDHVWIDFKRYKGIKASEFPHSMMFVKVITDFCVNNLQKTLPYVHGDWVLSNILIDGENMFMVDWDNIGIYPIEQCYEKLRNDLTSAFGDKFDPSSI